MAIDWDNVVITSDEGTVYANCGKAIVFAVTRTGSGGGNAVWGEITGTLTAQTDLKNALDAKADTADLGDLAYEDSVDYSDVTNTPTLGTMAAVNDAPSDGKTYGRKNGAWSEAATDSAIWGSITGTLSNQTDLQDALDSKEDTLTFDTAPTSGSTNPVTSNGIYQSYYRKADSDDKYAPVIKDDVTTTVTGSSFVKPANAQISELTIYFPFTQFGSGIPSSQNIREIREYKDSKITTLENYRIPEDVHYYTWQTPIIAEGSWNCLTGVVTATYGIIESYAGETLPGMWYSDRDVYAPGTTPTIGAQVAYEYATPIQFTIGTLEEIDTTDEVLIKLVPPYGSLSVTYSEYRNVDTKEYVDDQVATKLSDAPSDGKTYGRKNGTWAEVTGGGSGSASWGDITGTLSDQTDLKDALDAKQGTLTFDSVPTSGSTNPVTSDGIYDALADKADTSSLGSLATQDTVDYSTEVTNRPTLGALAGMSSIDYTSNYLTNKPTLGTMSAVNDAPSDGDEYVRKNGAWAVSSGITGVDWGDVGGTLADQTDLQTALDTKAPLASPALTGTPTAPTASSGTNTTQIATTAFVKTELAKEILYFYQQSTSATSAASAEFCRITDSKIDANTVVLECTFTVPSAITSDVSWESASGYISLKGICTSTNCKVNIALGQKGN